MTNGPWFHYRRQVAMAVQKVGLQPGDILIRLGAAKVYGLVNFSRIIARITRSKYSHAAIVLRVEPEIIVADVSREGLRRQYFLDWITDVYSDDFLILRYRNNDPSTSNTVIGFIEEIIKHDPGFDVLFILGEESLYCVELPCLAYDEAGVELCQAIPLKEMPGWTWYWSIVAWLHGINPDMRIWSAQKLVESEQLQTVFRMTLNDAKALPVPASRRTLNVLMYRWE